MPAREIRVLPDHVINQIAAGEVIERPASVVKELVENSIDAGARRVSIEIGGGGKTLIRVVDDGSGMSRGDIGLALTRHATSKLRDADELGGIDTMGFRGEALPSIAAVSRMTITSRRRGDPHPAAWEVEIHGGSDRGQREVGAPVGTTIEVRDLLYNLPVRQKFMRAEATESGHVAECVCKLALAHPEVHMRLRQKQRTTLDAPASRDPIERAAAVLGPRVAEQLVAASGEGGGVRVRAYLGAPQLAQKSARAISLFVGRRPIRDRGLLAAVLSGYREQLGAGRYPSALVFIDVRPGDLDVNVHPQKLEVRFAEPQTVYAVVKGVVERGIEEAGWRRQAFATSAGFEASPRATAASLPGLESQATRAAERLASYAGGGSRERDLFASRPARAARHPERDAPPIERSAVGGFFARLRYLGALEDAFIVCEGEGELVLVDLAVARRRLAIDALERQHQGGGLASQRLLFPPVIETDVELTPTTTASLRALGFEIDASTSTLETAPAGVDADEAAALAVAVIGAGSTRARLALISEALCPPHVLEPTEVLAALGAGAGTGETPLRRPGDRQPMVLRGAIDDLARLLDR